METNNLIVNINKYVKRVKNTLKIIKVTKGISKSTVTETGWDWSNDTQTNKKEQSWNINSHI